MRITKKTCFSVIYFLFFFTVIKVCGQDVATGLWFHNIHLPDDFIDRNIRCLEKDKNGFYWFATVNDLYKHNGFSVERIYDKNGKSISNISKLLIDEDTLWIASPIGVTKLQLSSWEFKQFSFKQFSSLINYNREITALVSEPDGSGILVGFKSNHIFKIHDDSVSLALDLSKKCGLNGRNAVINNIHFVNDYLEITTSHIALIFTVERTNGTYMVRNRFQSDRLWGRPISDIVFDHVGNALINNGIDTLYFVDRTKSQLIHIPLDPGITCGNLFKVNDSLSWAVSPNGYVYVFNFNQISLKRLPEVYSIPLKDKQMLNQKPDYTSNFTVYQLGTGKGIISLERYSGFWDIPMLNFTRSNSIRGIYEDETYGLYLGTYGEGLLHFHPDSGTKDIIHPTLYPYAFLKWSADSLIMAAEGLGLFWLDMSTSEWQPLFLNFDLQNKRHITSVQRISDRQLLVSCYEGLYVIDVYTHAYYDVAVPGMDRSINVMVYNAAILDHQLWVAASNGLYCFAYAFDKGMFTLTQELYVSEPQIPFTAIQLYQGKVYASSLGQGVFVIDTARLKDLNIIGVNNNLISNSIYSLVISEDYMMAGTDNGLSIFDLKTRQPFNFTMGNGLPHNEFNIASTLVSGDEVYMGTVNGLIKFNPRFIVQSQTIKKPHLKLTSVVIKKKGELRSFKDFTVLYKPDMPIEIESDVALFSLNFGMSSTEGIQHIDKLYYRLGKNESWTEMQSNQELRFGGLMPDDYVLQIATLNPDKSVSEILYENELLVRPAFIQSRWFYLLLIVLGGALGWGGFAYRKYLKQKEARLRTNIAEDLHDEVGGILTGLTMQADYWQYMEGAKKEEIARKITESGREAISSMHDIVWGFYEQEDNTVSLILRIKEYVQAIPDAVNLKIKLNIDERRLAHLTSEERRNIWLIFKEAITNIIKHAEATEATVSFEVRKPGYQWMLRIEDNGRGIAHSGGSNGNGLKNIKNRASRIKAKLMIEPNPLKGTSIILVKA